MMATEKETVCRACESKEVAEWLYPREMMFGLRDKFSYFRCASCGCLQIDQLPPNLEKYYPENYYSYEYIRDTPIPWKTAIKRKALYPSMTRHRLGWGGVFGQLLCRFREGPPFPEWLRFLTRPVSLNGAVLDVGCGSGANLLALRNCGFTNLLGVDPFISQSVSYAGGVRVNKCKLQDVQGKFRLITLHHVFEHLENPLETLRQARQLLSRGGQILIRIPVSDSAAAQKYKENWVQLDAPRHITLQTRKSMELIAGKSEMKIVRVVYDSNEFQFWASEQYLLGIPLFEARSVNSETTRNLFSPEQIRAFVAESERLNQQEEGDQAAFVLEDDQSI